MLGDVITGNGVAAPPCFLLGGVRGAKAPFKYNKYIIQDTEHRAWVLFCFEQYMNDKMS